MSDDVVLRFSLEADVERQTVGTASAPADQKQTISSSTAT